MGSDGRYFHYTYDPVGNRLSEEKCLTPTGCVTPITNTYDYDDANRLIEVNEQAYDWDDNGNLLDDGPNTYTYDAANRLTGVTDGVTPSTYTYNGLGDRLSQTLDSVTTDYVLDLNAGLTQVLDDGTNTYLYGQGRIGELQPGGFAYHLGDALGSVRQLSDVSGDVTLAKSYEPFGSMLTSTGSGSSAFAFTGEQWDSQTGLLYLRARYYSSISGRFFQKDRWPGYNERPSSLNGWLYAENNSVNWVDPSGYYRWRNTGSLNHQDVEDFLALTYGYWNIHLEYKIGPGKKGTRIADLVYFPYNNSMQSVFYPGVTVSDVYEIEPYNNATWVKIAQDEVQQKVDKLKEFETLLFGVTSGDITGGTYDWRKVIWSIGDDPLPKTPTLIHKSSVDGTLLIWYEDDGAIMFTDSDWDDTKLKQLPPYIFDWLKEHKQDSRENQQFYEMVTIAKGGISVSDLPGLTVPVPSEEETVVGVVTVCTIVAVYIGVKLAEAAVCGPCALLPVP